MDEEEIKSFGNIPQDLEKSFNYLTPAVMDSSSTEFDDGSEKEGDLKLPKTVSNVSIGNSLNDEFTALESVSSTTTINMNNTNTEMENQELDNVCNLDSNNEEDKNIEFEPNILLTSTNNYSEENVNRSQVLNETALVEESAALSSMTEILAAKDSGIALDVDEEIVFNRADEHQLIEPSIRTELPKSNSERLLDEKNAVEIVPENINDVKPNSDIFDTLLPKLSNNDEEETICNCDSEIQQSSLDELVKNVQEPHLNSQEYLIRSKSAAEMSAVCKSKPHSLAEDAKLVKFSVSTKSVNIMQSNAQFLNKSRNFINFITEKSTNIMEKTLLPQNLAAKYNSILRLTENNPSSYKKCIEENSSSSDSAGINTALNSDNGSAHNSDTYNQIPYDVTKLDLLDADTTNFYSREREDEPASSNYGIQKDSTNQNRTLFLKCSVNESKSDPAFPPTIPQTEISSISASANINSEISEFNSNFETANMIKGEKLSSSDFGGTANSQNVVKSSTMSDTNSSDKVSTEMQEKSSALLCGDSDISSGEDIINMGMNEKDLTEENEINDLVDSSGNKSNAGILHSLRTVSIEHLDKEEKGNGSKSTGDQVIDLALLAHPAYVTLLRDYSNLKDQSAKLSETMVKVEMENQRVAAENNPELHALQLEGLEKTIEQLKHDLKQSNASQELLNKEYILANKEKESMVMKYAISEKQLIDTQRAREYAERKVNEALKEQELLHTKLKQVQGERTRICNILDGKCHELTNAQKEVERLKEESSMREVKLKWTQNKLKTELESHKENQQKLDKAMLRIHELKEECEQVRKESHETIRKFQQSEENKVVTLDHQLKEQQARLILERHVTEDKELSRLQLQKEVETLKQRQHALIEENNTLSLKVQNLEKERLNYENNLSNLKVIADQRQKEILDLVGKVSQLETLQLQLKHKEQLLSSNEAEVERLRQSNTELQSDMEWCREREAHMLDFTQKLTDKNVRLQSEFTSLEAKNEQLELEQGPLHEQIKELSSKVKALEISLASEKSKRTEECELLARHVAEQTQLARNLAQKLEDSQGENAVLRRKQQISVKEMTKELLQCKKRLDAFEAGSPSNSLDRTSRTGSSSSLSTGETLNGTVSDNSNSGDNILQSVEPDRQTLIDRIVKLQRIRVRQAEKLDFLEEHTRTLVNELQKKTKIIKNYILHENPDAMGSNERDRNKAELARHGGIMASVYNQRVSDDNMTLELSLEINQKLQAVLEDTLLKNITLKDSIDTLGGEIARLTMQNKRRQ